MKIDQVVSNPQVFNYYYMTPNYNLKLTNHDPNAVIEVPSKFQGPEKQMVQNLLSSSQGVIKLCENEQVISMSSKRRVKRQKKGKSNRNFKLGVAKKSLKTSEKEQKQLSKNLRIMTGLIKNEDPRKSNPMTPSFFKKKTFCEVDSSNLLSRDPSQLNNSENHQKITFGILPFSHEKGLTDFESSMSIPLNNSNIPKGGRELGMQESPLFNKKFYEPKNVLYSSMAFSMSSSLETSTKFSKLIKNLPKKKSKHAKKGPSIEVNRSTNTLQTNKEKIKILKSKRKMQIRMLKEKTDFKELKKKYSLAKKQSYKGRGTTAKGSLASEKARQGNKTRVLNPISMHTSGRAPNNNDEFERRILMQMRKTTDLGGASLSNQDLIDRQLLSVQNSKVHPFVYETPFPKPSKKKSKKERHTFKSPKMNIFKQRMSSNVELGRRVLFNEGLNQSLDYRAQDKAGKDYDGIHRSRARKKYSWRDTPASTLRKNTSLDLVLKKKSIKFMDMEKDMLNNLNRKMKNIYRLSSPSLKHVEDSVINTDSVTFATRKAPKKKNSRKNQSKKPKRQVKGKLIKQTVGSVDFDDNSSQHKSTVFESSLKIFRGKLNLENLKEMKKFKNPRFFEKPLQKKKKKTKNTSLFKRRPKKPRVGLGLNLKATPMKAPLSKNKVYCSSQAQNSVPGEAARKMREKFNKSSLCQPKRVFKKGKKISLKTQLGHNGLFKKAINKKNLKGFSFRVSKERSKQNFLQNSVKSTNVYSGPNSYSNSKKNLIILGNVSKSIKTIGHSRQTQNKETNPENYFSVTSDERTGQFNLIPSVVSLGADNSIYSHQPKDNEEFNLYCVDDGNPANSASQMDIIYNKPKRKPIQTTSSHKGVSAKGLFGAKSRSIRGFKGNFKQSRFKNHSFQNNPHN